MGLMAERAGGRMQARQTYRTMSRMQRRRSFVQSKTWDEGGLQQPRGAGRRRRRPPPPPSPSTWASWNVSPSCASRASSAMRSSRPRRSRSSGSERNARRVADREPLRKGEHCPRSSSRETTREFVSTPGRLAVRY